MFGLRSAGKAASALHRHRACSFDSNGHHFTLIDTPGYPDFLGRTFAVLEAVESTAIVISATASVDLVPSALMEFARRAVQRQVISTNVASKDARPGPCSHSCGRVVACLRLTRLGDSMRRSARGPRWPSR